MRWIKYFLHSTKYKIGVDQHRNSLIDNLGQSEADGNCDEHPRRKFLNNFKFYQKITAPHKTRRSVLGFVSSKLEETWDRPDRERERFWALDKRVSNTHTLWQHELLTEQKINRINCKAKAKSKFTAKIYGLGFCIDMSL